MPPAPLLESFSALSDSTRCRMLLVLEQRELTVSELCVVLQLPQSTVSRHLKVLSEAGLLQSRREATSRYYSLALDNAGGGAAELWPLVRREFADRPVAAQDSRRVARVLAARGAVSREFFAASAAQWDQLRDELFGDQFYWRALLGLLPPSWVVADLGCGTGAVASALAPYVARVIGVDGSDEMLQAAAVRLAVAGSGLESTSEISRTSIQDLTPTSRIELRRGPLEALPIESGTVDAATLVLVLHHLPSPADALGEAFRVLKPGGRVLIADMAPHEHEEYRQRMGHVWLGFSDAHVRRMLEQSGFAGIQYHPLPATTEAKGPALFAASGSKP